MNDNKIRSMVGGYLIVGEGKEWRVMEQFGSHRMLKKVFRSQLAAETRARQMIAGVAS